MINTAEFWVGVSFIVCCGVFYKLILPKLDSALAARQEEIERLFSDAEAILKAAEKKFSRTQERLDALPTLIAAMEKEFDSKVNQLLDEWSAQKEHLSEQYRHVGQHKLDHLKDHVRRQLYDQIINGSLNVLKGYFSKHIDAKAHQQLVINSLDILKKL